MMHDWIGLTPDLPMSVYRSMTAVGATDLWTLTDECPAVAVHRKQFGSKGSDATKLGSAVHAAILEGSGVFAARYAVRPAGLHGNSNAYKEWKAAQSAEGKEVISGDDMEIIERIRDALSPTARALFREGRAEVTGVMLDEESGLYVKTRPDWLRAEGVVVNLKTAADIRPRAWARQAANLGYHLSAALCLDVLQAVTGKDHEYWFLVVAKEAPHLSYLARLMPADIEAGRKLYRAALQTWADCVKANKWPGYGEFINVELPAWAHKEE